ncbi:MAG: hypothetical protein H6741_32600 [Alphaproteobacteria bacterium]|nr:hypothetical protein [Alphaproteobacteria bacterium]MCB9797456.1 hypothetical protein [Alphaproteobacteria bacterium]
MHATRHALTLALLLSAGCDSDTGFQNTTNDNQDVEGSGDMEFSPAELVFEDMVVGSTYSQDITFTAVGEVNLTIYEVLVITSGEGTFYLGDTEDLVIAPGTSLPITVAASLEADQVQQGRLRVKTNDIDYTEFIIPMIACPESFEGDCADVNDTGGAGGEDSSADDTGA